ncbi:MAG: RsmD family RNA methyltransferase [Bacteroidales bacterium]
MRIIGGRYKGRRIVPPAGLKARPTTDFAREGLFNILNNRFDFESVTVLDLFSGTGSISFEFASRGAVAVHLIEKDKKNIEGIKRIIRETGFINIKPVHIDVKSFLKVCTFRYDIVFADPPYDLSWFVEVPGLVFQSGVMKDDSILILEHPRRMSFSEHKSFFEHRSYGGVNFSFFRQEG